MKKIFVFIAFCLMAIPTMAIQVNAGGLRDLFDKNNLWNANNVSISGSINGSDVKVLREWMRDFRTLDLSECKIVAGGDPYYENYTTEEDVIGSYMFGDRPVKKLVLPKTLKKIGDYAISFCGEEIDFPSSLTWVGDNAFTENNFVKLHIPATLTHIGNGAFNGNIALEQVTIDADNPEYVMDGQYLYTRDHTRLLAFWGSIASRSDSFTILPQVKIIDNKAFNYHRTNQIVLNDGLEYIGEEAFKLAVSNGLSQQELVIPNSVTYIGAGAFAEANISSVIISDNVERLGDKAFAGCGVFYIHLPSKLKYLGQQALQNNSVFNLELPNGLEFIGKLALASTRRKRLVIPQSVKTIEEQAFSYALTDTFDIQAPLDSIPQRAFEGCQSIRQVVLPPTIKKIGVSAFSNCREMEDCKLPEGLEEIREWAFADCRHMMEWHIPSTVCKIELGAFSGDNMWGKVYIYAKEPPAETHEWAFRSWKMSESVLFVPTGCLEKYRHVAPWSDFGDIREFEPTSVSKLSYQEKGQNMFIYTLSGQRITSATRGLQIIKTPDGKTKKLVVR